MPIAWLIAWESWYRQLDWAQVLDPVRIRRSQSSACLHLSSDGYGLLLGCVAIGAVGDAALLPRLAPDCRLTRAGRGSALNSLYQLTLPQWSKACGMSFYLIVFQDGDAIGSTVMGIKAQHAGLSCSKPPPAWHYPQALNVSRGREDTCPSYRSRRSPWGSITGSGLGGLKRWDHR